MGGVSYGHERQQESYNRDSPKPGKCSSHLHALPGIPFYDGRRNKPGFEYGIRLTRKGEQGIAAKVRGKRKSREPRPYLKNSAMSTSRYFAIATNSEAYTLARSCSNL